MFVQLSNSISVSLIQIYSRGWNVELAISAPQIIMPEDIFDKNSSVVSIIFRIFTLFSILRTSFKNLIFF